MEVRNAQFWIDHLQLEPHPEGGFFRQTYRAGITTPNSALPAAFKGDRFMSTAIYFLLESSNFSAFHRLASDEMWHFYTGGPLIVHVIDDDGHYWNLKLGPDPNHGELFQAVVPGGRWFASCLENSKGFALVGCTVSPGFDFADFEMADRSSLSAQYPQHADLIRRFTR